MQTVLKGKNQTHVLKLTTANLLTLEAVLGYNPLEVVNAFNRGKIPKLTDVIKILHFSLHPFVDEDKRTMEIFDDFIDAGNSFIDLIKIFNDVFSESGLLPKKEEAPKNV